MNCGLCCEEIVFEDDLYTCDKCEERYCQTCFMCLPEQFKSNPELSDREEYEELCVCCLHDIRWDDHPSFIEV
jgi:hypothetical protein